MKIIAENFSLISNKTLRINAFALLTLFAFLKADLSAKSVKNDKDAPLPFIKNSQEQFEDLFLEKNGVQVLIPINELMVISDAFDPNNTIQGIFLGMDTDVLRIQDEGESFIREIHINEIGSIFLGDPKSIREHVLSGMKLGGMVSFGIGGAVTVLIAMEGRDPYETLPSIYIGGMVAMLTSFYTLPGGALYGYMRAKNNKREVEYKIGEGNWLIIYEK